MTGPGIPQGFKISGVAAGIKEGVPREGPDLGLIYSETAATTAALFTRNAFPAAPILLSRANLEQSGHKTRALLVNSGNANAVTGPAGMAAAQACAEGLAVEFGCPPAEIFVASTGVIGRPLPFLKILAAIPGLVATMSSEGSERFARAIMTTDTFPKTAAAEAPGIQLLGFAKGAGMIHPNMATMLAFIVTDARIEFPELDQALRKAVDLSFHSISVDGDTSTNDVVVVMANGASGISLPAAEFTEKLTAVCQSLAKAIVRDGEGASKFIELNIEGAPSDEAARHIGRTIAVSPLVKTAIYGCDPNWGRIVGAIGNAGIPLTSSQVELYIDDIPLIGGDLKLASERLKSPEIRIRVVLHSGTGRARVWTCDLTEGYIRINADYTT